MKFLSVEELKEIYNTSLEFSCYQSLNNFIIDLWSKFVLSGYSDLPIGFLARLTEKMTHILYGTDNTDNSERNSYELQLIDIISRSKGFKQIEGEFIISGNKLNPDKLFLALEKVLEKIPVFSMQNLKFTAKDLEQSLSLNNENNNTDYFLELETIMKTAIEEIGQYHDLIDEEDLFEIKNPELFLADQRARKLYRIMNKAIKDINFYLIGEINLKPENDYVIGKFGEEQVLPVGGYDSLINRGDISSLLPSELAYIDNTQKIDYFDYKYMQKELLYYKREEGSIFRMRRSILFDIEVDYSAEHERNLAVLFAFCLSTVEKLINVFTKDIIEIHIVFSGNLPSGINYAINFFQYFIKKQKYDENIFIHDKDKKSLAFEKSNYQNWTIGKKPTTDEKFISFSFPSFDTLNIMDSQTKAKIIADSINDIIERLVDIADS